jgi:uncharacterized damage-inducible protein DinB
MPSTLDSLWQHARWADLRLLPAATHGSTAARTEFAHAIGAMEVWLSRIRQRPSRLPVWPDPTDALSEQLVSSLHDDFSLLLGLLAEAELPAVTSYLNSAGVAFETPTVDILTHVPLHAQYHRGKVNLLLRESGIQPVPVDYISWIRGVAAATSPQPGP